MARYGNRVLCGAATLVLLLALACATRSAAPAPGRSSLFGTLRLVPRGGVKPGGSGATPYSDRSLRDVEFVDYAHPGFAVVYLEGRDAPSGTHPVAIRASKLRTRLEPSEVALGAGGTLQLRNETADAHIVSFPSGNLVRRVGAGEVLSIPVAARGPQALFLLDVPGAESAVFAAPGPYAVAARDGRWEIRDVEPGRVRLNAWHPRFPAPSRWVDLAPDAAERIDLELGVGHLSETPDETD